MIKINQRKKSNMSDLHKTSIPIRLKNQNLIFCTSLVIFFFSFFFVSKNKLWSCPFVVPVTSHLSRMFVCLVSLHELCTLGVSQSLSLSLAFPVSSLSFSSFLPCSSLLFCSTDACAVECFFFHVFSPCLPLSLCAGDVLFQMAEVHRQIQVQLEEMVCILSSKGFFRSTLQQLSIKLWLCERSCNVIFSQQFRHDNKLLQP